VEAPASRRRRAHEPRHRGALGYTYGCPILCRPTICRTHEISERQQRVGLAKNRGPQPGVPSKRAFCVCWGVVPSPAHKNFQVFCGTGTRGPRSAPLLRVLGWSRSCLCFILTLRHKDAELSHTFSTQRRRARIHPCVRQHPIPCHSDRARRSGATEDE
jgi:hypothetical protein